MDKAASRIRLPFYLTNVLHLEDKEGSFDKKHGDERKRIRDASIYTSKKYRSSFYS